VKSLSAYLTLVEGRLNPGESSRLMQGWRATRFAFSRWTTPFPGALAYEVKTDADRVVYTGDLRLNEELLETPLRFAEEAPGLKVVLQRTLKIVKLKRSAGKTRDRWPQSPSDQVLNGFLEIAEMTNCTFQFSQRTC